MRFTPITYAGGANNVARIRVEPYRRADGHARRSRRVGSDGRPYAQSDLGAI